MKYLSKKAKPFLKWAGGKTQLIEQIKNNLPEIVFKEKFTYIEPFVGSGAVLFWLLSEFPNMKKAVINDINKELIDTYEVIAQNPHDLISILEILQNEYHELEGNQEDKKQYYYEKRNLFNLRNKGKIEQSALFIFLNRTCFNGLYYDGFNI
jgi:modification methylase mboIA